MRSRSSSSVRVWCRSQRQPCAQTSYPAALIASQTSGLRSSARPQPSTVAVMPRECSIRCTRQKPMRLPYSNIDSAARSRPVKPPAPPSVNPVSDSGSPSGTEGSPPSS
ncbi:hypothetical protein G6F23_015639 [Rhizopus arrhizus]|nr:hypothetical protein G6F23_015639 [Rhizopus arrhizus]